MLHVPVFSVYSEMRFPVPNMSQIFLLTFAGAEFNMFHSKYQHKIKSYFAMQIFSASVFRKDDELTLSEWMVMMTDIRASTYKNIIQWACQQYAMAGSAIDCRVGSTHGSWPLNQLIEHYLFEKWTKFFIQK